MVKADRPVHPQTWLMTEYEKEKYCAMQLSCLSYHHAFHALLVTRTHAFVLLMLGA